MASEGKVVIIGSGPSGYTAAVYLARAQLAPVLFSGKEVGGQLMYTTEVENYPGFANGVSGPKLMMEMRAQAERFGAEIIGAEVTKIERAPGGGWTVWQGETPHQARAILIATGAQARMMSLPGESEYLGRGLSVCAVCDAAFFREKNVFVVGGGDSAMEDALALTKFASHVTVLHRRDSFRASKIMQDRVLNHPKITVRWNSQVSAIQGDGTKLTGIEVEDVVSHQKTSETCEGLFYAIGHVPATGFLEATVQRNREGYIITRLGLDKDSVALAQSALDESGRVLWPTMTSAEGIFAAGDCVDFHYRQAVTAAGFGTMAALDVERWLETQA